MLTHRFLEARTELVSSGSASPMRPTAFVACPVAVCPAQLPLVADMYRVAFEFAQAQVAHERRIRRLAFSVN